MTTSNKNFKVKNGLEVLGTTATVDGENVLTRSQSDINYLNTVIEASGDIYSYGDTPPENPNIGDRWIDSESGFEYTWLDDGDSVQWVETRGSGYVGPPNELTVDSVTTGLPGTNVEITISGESPNQSLSFIIPRGDKGEIGDPNELTVGTVTTGEAEADAEVIITGDAPNQTINFVIPQGIQGIEGEVGPRGLSGVVAQNEPPEDTSVVWIDTDEDGVGIPIGGTTGQVLAKVDSGDFNTEWITPSGGGSSKEVRHEWAPPYDYIATAPSSTLDSETTWTITRIEVFADGTTSTTTSTDSWDNRETAAYL